MGVAHGGWAHVATRPRPLERRLGRISGCSAARHWANRLSPGTPGKPIALEIGFKANNQFAFGIGFEANTNSTVESVSRRTPVGLEIGFKPKTNRTLWREPAAKRQKGNLGFTRPDARSWSYTLPGMTSDPSDLPPVGLVDCRLGENKTKQNKTISYMPHLLGHGHCLCLSLASTDGEPRPAAR